MLNAHFRVRKCSNIKDTLKKKEKKRIKYIKSGNCGDRHYKCLEKYCLITEIFHWNMVCRLRNINNYLMTALKLLSLADQ